MTYREESGRTAIASEQVPSRQVLSAAEEANRRSGHENLGFLSESHGFLPVTAPLFEFPESHRAWDELAASLPDLHRTLTLRRAFDALELLSAEEAELPDPYLLRASMVLSMCSHAYQRVELKPPERLPEGLHRPWETVSRRLGRKRPMLSYIDVINYNWRMREPRREDPMRVENLRRLISPVGTEHDEVSHLAQVEILAHAAPVVGAIVRAQEAVADDDPQALERELERISDTLKHVTHVSFMKLNPNPYSDSYVDPIMWAKTVAPFAVPIEEGVPGPSGTSAPLFPCLDVFFGRRTYESVIGQEMLHSREWHPQHWQDFFRAVGEVSVAGYVERKGNRALRGMFEEALNAYMGEDGFLGRHRLKAYGYLDLAFKMGRIVTVGGFYGAFQERAWEEVDDALEASRVERQNRSLTGWHQVPVRRSEAPPSAGTAGGTAGVNHVVLDLEGAGIRYEVGDRCCILPENSPELIARTLRALRAEGDETVLLNTAWREAIALRDGYEKQSELPLRELLRFGQVRPVTRPIARALYAITHNEKLRQIIEARAEDQWEIWDLLELLTAAGFDPRTLWKAHPGDRESICWIIPPEQYRMYSISSSPRAGIGDAVHPSELHLSVGQLHYRTPETEVTRATARAGTASAFMARVAREEHRDRLSVKMVHPPRFNLPKDASRPIVMFAGGTGIAPFRGFILERAQQQGAGESWLFLGTRTRDEFYYHDELARLAVQGKLEVRVAFSREEVEPRLVRDGSNGADARFELVPGPRQRIGDLMLREENARLLWELLRSREEGGSGAFFYVCGRAGFAAAVMQAIKAIIVRFAQGSEEESERTARQMLYRLIAKERFLQEVFTTYTGSQIEQRRLFDASDLVLHNQERNGYWMAISGRVYDMTEFAHLHPGGFKIVRGYVGMDATVPYQRVLHHVRPEVDALLAMYEIGAVRRLHFGSEWGVVIDSKGLRFIYLADAFRTWVRFLYLVVEMENALHNDYTVQHHATTRGESPISRSPYKMQWVAEVHQRFLENYVKKISGQALEELWAVTSGLCTPREDVHWMRRTLAAIWESEEARAVEEFSGRLEAAVKSASSSGNGEFRWLVAGCKLLEAEDKWLFHQLKLVLREGVRLFERHEQETIRAGSTELMNVIKRVPTVIELYFARVLAGMQLLEESSVE